jgi:DNA polymerase III subunit alpha
MSISSCTNYIVFDTETTGLPQCSGFNKFPFYADLAKYDNSRVIQLSYQVYTSSHVLITEQNLYIKPDGFRILNEEFHKITNEFVEEHGISIHDALEFFITDIRKYSVDILIGHNIVFDINIVASELYRMADTVHAEMIYNFKTCCTMLKTQHIIKKEITNKNGKRYVKFPSLRESYEFFALRDIENQHNALYDVRSTAFIYQSLCVLE